MPRPSRHGERGQTLPFWIVAVLLSLGLTFFSFNYANTVRWQVRAQNAADSAASAVLGEDAAAANSATTLTYALMLQDVRSRSVNNDLKALVANATSDTSCASLIATQCVSDYSYISQDLTSNTQRYNDLVHSVSQFTGQTTDIIGSSANANDLLNKSLLGASSTAQNGAGCVQLNTDCGFHYTTQLSVDPAGSGQIIADVYACRRVPTAGAGIIGFISDQKASNVAQQSQTFYAIGHAREMLAPASSGSIDPGSDVNPLTGTVYQPAEQIDPNITASENYTSFSSLSLSPNYLIPRAAPPAAANASTVSALCPPNP